MPAGRPGRPRPCYTHGVLAAQPLTARQVDGSQKVSWPWTSSGLAQRRPAVVGVLAGVRRAVVGGETGKRCVWSGCRGGGGRVYGESRSEVLACPVGARMGIRCGGGFRRHGQQAPAGPGSAAAGITPPCAERCAASEGSCAVLFLLLSPLAQCSVSSKAERCHRRLLHPESSASGQGRQW